MAKAPNPNYSRAKPPYLDGTYEQPTTEIGGDVIITGGSSGGGKPLELIEGTSMKIEDQSNSQVNRFIISYDPYIDPEVALTLVAKESGVARTNPVLKGTVIDAIELDWTVSKDVTTQELTNSGGLVPPDLEEDTRSYDYTGVAVSANVTLTVTVGDGTGTDSDAKSIVFGNNIALGAAVDMSGGPLSALVTAFAGMTKVIKTSRVHTYFATGGVNQKHYVFIPKSFGDATFTKGIFTGGYVRLKNVSNVLKIDLLEGDVESDINFANSKGFSEAYNVYMSLYDNQNDPVNPFVIS
jgi:hypothetical protein